MVTGYMKSFIEVDTVFCFYELLSNSLIAERIIVFKLLFKKIVTLNIPYYNAKIIK